MDVKVKGRAGLLSPDPWPIQSLARALLSSTCPPPPVTDQEASAQRTGTCPGHPVVRTPGLPPRRPALSTVMAAQARPRGRGAEMKGRDGEMGGTVGGVRRAAA